jgi:CRP-like cAMP-binding protein
MSSAPLQNPELPALGIVEHLSSEDRAMLCSYGAFKFLSPHGVLIEQGSEQESLYLVLSGELHAVRRDDGREILLGTIRQGESIGEVNIFDPGKASATVRAVTPTQIWQVERPALIDFFQAYPEASVTLTVQIASVLSRRLRGLSAKLEDKVQYEVLLADLS